MNVFFNYLICALVSYLLGSLTFGVIFSKAKYGNDIRKQGSKNAGATNMLRTYGKIPALAVFLCDIAKGVAAVLLAKYLFCGNADSLICAYTAAVFSVLGHMFPVFFKFKGGKGAATAIGVTTTLAWQTLPILMIPFFITVAISKMVSLSSIVSAFILPFATFAIYRLWYPQFSPVAPTIATAVMAAFIIFMHRSNIVRILHGEESKLGSKKHDNSVSK